jgi:uncharacterized protein YoxC
LSGGDIAGIVAALAFAVLVGVLSTVLLRAHKVLAEAEHLVVDVRRSAIPLMEDVRGTLQAVTHELDRVDGILASVSTVSSGVSGVAGLVTSATTNPLVKGLAFLAGARASVKALRKGDE